MCLFYFFLYGLVYSVLPIFQRKTDILFLFQAVHLILAVRGDFFYRTGYTFNQSCEVIFFLLLWFVIHFNFYSLFLSLAYKLEGISTKLRSQL